MKRISLFLLLISIAALFVVACNRDDHSFNRSKTFVLVHGAWQAPYVWDEVKKELEEKGQQVITVELPAHGDDVTAPLNTSIDIYRDKVIAALNKVGGKVILVGHSMGGVVVSAVAEKIPKQIEKLIYIAAFVPSTGQSLIDLTSTDGQSLLGPSLIPSADQLTLDVKRENIVNIFCQDAPADKQQLVLDKFRVEPAIPFTNKVTLSADNFGKVSKSYIYTLQDHAIGIDNQRRMASAAGITQTFSLNTGHSPFLSKPSAVTGLLLSIAK